jgi:hypothetical protein
METSFTPTTTSPPTAPNLRGALPRVSEEARKFFRRRLGEVAAQSPRESFERDLAKLGVSLASVRELTRRYGAPGPAPGFSRPLRLLLPAPQPRRRVAVHRDHIDPRLKSKSIQSYKNLFLATRHCNGAKGDTWPTRAEQALGLRFLNPCAEQDYGEHIVEDARTHRLVGVTPAGRFHIRMLDLNAEHLVAERRERAKIRELLTRAVFTLKRSRPEADVVELVAALRRQVGKMMPVFAAMPRTATVGQPPPSVCASPSPPKSSPPATCSRFLPELPLPPEGRADGADGPVLLFGRP